MPTYAEEILWERIRNRRMCGAKFRRQYAIEGFIVDFVCIEHRLILEVDGSIHHCPDQQDYDRERQMLLEGHGFRVLRFVNAELLHSLAAVEARIEAALRDA